MRKKVIFRWVKVLLLLYGIIGIAFYYLQDYLLFRPVTLERDYKYAFRQPHREVNLPYDSASNLHIVQFTTDSPATRLVLYFHGNRANIERYARLSEIFTRQGYEVWMIEYPGYGKSTGELSENRLYAYAEQFYKLGRSKFSRDSIILYGKSLGTGMAAYIASRHACKALVLECPYYSMTELASHYFPIYPVSRMVHFKLPTNEYLKNVLAPVTVFHGTKDRVIPYSHARRLSEESFKKGDTLITIQDGSHHSLPRSQQYIDRINRVCQ